MTEQEIKILKDIISQEIAPIKTEIAAIHQQVEAIKEDTEITREGVNSLIEWAEEVAITTGTKYPVSKAAK